MQKQKYQGMKTDGRGCEEGLRKKNKRCRVRMMMAQALKGG